MYMERMILFLIRWKLGVKKYEKFRFTNQKKPDIYYFSNKRLMKMVPVKRNVFPDGYLHKQSKVGINWLISKECRVTKV